ncbi:bifunctional protein-serine/threonine kinase/phosphatase [Parasedimentitalea marina]|uniref:Bifunctional protein-serine/threonine kinase/phosphatase n=1 Tax=Parasedimentitalea marina TaxID=2483033 RepID=A0A3T0N614_9RHOB|nr:bifunctional protein-serine/threonine kinase/phosphatase [Parasedimentitalea marina]AZV79411.1 bifunctional protein-serine/threonine kinase/phosphatase [Parasedimentitalea marina]
MVSGPKISIGQFSARGQKDTNDDSYGVLTPEGPELVTKGIAMAIADGVSTSEAAKAASETCIKSFLSDYYATHDSWTVRTSVERVMTAMNRWLYSQNVTHYLSDRGMLSTFSAMVLKSACAYLFHVGDSRIYLARDGKVEVLTTDHNLRISRKQEYLARAVGFSPDLQVDYLTVPVQPGDYFIFTTDGVHNHIADGRMLSLITETPDDLDTAARAIVAEALANGSADNLTCQIVRTDDPGKPDEETYLKRLTALPFPPELAPGLEFEGYRIVRELHASSRSQVYLAVEVISGDQVALKTPSVNYQDDPTYIEMFTREEWVGRMIANPHVLKVLQPVRQRRSLYYVTEYIEGQTLRQWMDDTPEPDLQGVRSIIEQLSIGLRAFNRKEIIHQDLKPDNIMIDLDGTVHIIDFGSSRVAGLVEVETPVEQLSLLGTADYIAPEYHMGQPPSRLSDMYSLAVIAYEMLTGKLPYQGKGFHSARDVARLSYVSALEHNNRIPVWVDGALSKALQVSPKARYDRLTEFVTDLKRPNPEMVNRHPKPLMQRNPVAFWQAVALISILGNLAVYYFVFG